MPVRRDFSYLYVVFEIGLLFYSGFQAKAHRICYIIALWLGNFIRQFTAQRSLPANYTVDESTVILKYFENEFYTNLQLRVCLH